MHCMTASINMPKARCFPRVSGWLQRHVAICAAPSQSQIQSSWAGLLSFCTALTTCMPCSSFSLRMLNSLACTYSLPIICFYVAIHMPPHTKQSTLLSFRMLWLSATLLECAMSLLSKYSLQSMLHLVIMQGSWECWCRWGSIVELFLSFAYLQHGVTKTCIRTACIAKQYHPFHICEHFMTRSCGCTAPPCIPLISLALSRHCHLSIAQRGPVLCLGFWTPLQLYSAACLSDKDIHTMLALFLSHWETETLLTTSPACVLANSTCCTDICAYLCCTSIVCSIVLSVLEPCVRACLVQRKLETSQITGFAFLVNIPLC